MNFVNYGPEQSVLNADFWINFEDGDPNGLFLCAGIIRLIWTHLAPC